MFDPSDTRAIKAPFGDFEGWQKFLSQYREGDEFYFHRSNYRTWANLGGRERYILIRKNEFIDSYIIKFN